MRVRCPPVRRDRYPPASPVFYKCGAPHKAETGLVGVEATQDLTHHAQASSQMRRYARDAYSLFVSLRAR